MVISNKTKKEITLLYRVPEPWKVIEKVLRKGLECYYLKVFEFFRCGCKSEEGKEYDRIEGGETHVLIIPDNKIKYKQGIIYENEDKCELKTRIFEAYVYPEKLKKRKKVFSLSNIEELIKRMLDEGLGIISIPYDKEKEGYYKELLLVKLLNELKKHKDCNLIISNKEDNSLYKNRGFESSTILFSPIESLEKGTMNWLIEKIRYYHLLLSLINRRK